MKRIEANEKSQLKRRAKAFIERHSMLEQALGVVVAVSGGPDSVALLDLLHRLRKEAPKGSPLASLRLHVAHLNHRLRSDESATDAEFVRNLAQSLGLPVTIDSVDVQAEAQRTRRGIEETARELRYAFLLKTAVEAGCDRIATGHTMTDQAETFLMRLTRGTGTRGLAGIRPVSAAHKFGDQSEINQRVRDPVLLIRPLLSVTRDEVEAYCRKRSLAFRIDASNLARDFTRNRMRLDVLPRLRGLNPNLEESLARAAQTAALDNDALDQIAREVLNSAAMAESDIQQSGVRRRSYAVLKLLDAPEGIRRRALILAIEQHRASVSDSPGAQITTKHLDAVDFLLRGESSGKHVELPDGLTVWRESDAIVIKIASEGENAGDYCFELNSTLNEIKASGVVLQLERGLAADSLEGLISQNLTARARGCDWTMAVFDGELLPEKLLVRPRRRGERALVVGQARTKRLKNLMIDHRIAASQRKSWPIVTTLDGRYVWAPRLPLSKEFAAHQGTLSLAVLRVAEDVAEHKARLASQAGGTRMEKNLRVIKSKEEIQARIAELAEQIRAVAPPSGLTVVGILDDAFVFLADLIRALQLPMSCCFMKVERHRHGGQSEVIYTSEFDPQGLDILLVGGICATGVTLDYITKQLASRGIKSLRTCMLVDKAGERRLDLNVDFAAFRDIQGYVFGYGMGIQSQYRQLPYLAAIEE